MKYLILLFLFLSNFIQAQDIHFSQMNTAPLYMNPSTTGFFNGDYRFTAIYRNQWATVTVPYKSISASTDYNFLSKSNLLGLGFLVFSDRAGDSKFTTNMFAVSLSYDKALDAEQTLFTNFGIQAGYTNSYLDYTNLNFEENYLGAPLTETFTTDNYGYFDTNLGFSTYYLPSKDLSFEFGASAFHLNNPVQTYTGDLTAIIPKKYIFNLEASLPIDRMSVLYPKIFYSYQKPHQELVMGVLGRIKMEKNGKDVKAFYLGILDRWNDAFILVAKMDINKFSINLVYDINYSGLVKASYAQGGPEIAIQYIGDSNRKKHHKIYCPAF